MIILRLISKIAKKKSNEMKWDLQIVRLAESLGPLALHESLETLAVEQFDRVT